MDIAAGMVVFVAEGTGTSPEINGCFHDDCGGFLPSCTLLSFCLASSVLTAATDLDLVWRIGVEVDNRLSQLYHKLNSYS
jgi:hypothetical protein